jgi:hypothetical protein
VGRTPLSAALEVGVGFVVQRTKPRNQNQEIKIKKSKSSQERRTEPALSEVEGSVRPT